ncbi:MAG: hypothetical protein KDB00_20410 [Planctomycetales bacterium]|nr:hypothetical protein [Planctomycetales bacterium]
MIVATADDAAARRGRMPKANDNPQSMIAMTEMQHNPYQPPTSPPELSVAKYPRRKSLSLRSLLALQALVIVVSLALEAYQHETIVGTGAFFTLVGIAISLVAWRSGDSFAFAYGLSAVAFSTLIVFLINYNQWGPPQGNRPITILAFIYAAIALPATAWLYNRRLEDYG